MRLKSATETINAVFHSAATEDQKNLLLDAILRNLNYGRMTEKVKVLLVHTLRALIPITSNHLFLEISRQIDLYYKVNNLYKPD